MVIKLKNIIKKLDKKIISFVLSIFFLSTLLCSLTDFGVIYQKALNNNFYNSYLLGSAVSSLLENSIYSVSDIDGDTYKDLDSVDYSKDLKEKSKDILLNQRNIAFLIVNHENGEVLSNRGIKDENDLNKFKEFSKVISVNVKNNQVSGISKNVISYNLNLSSFNEDITIKLAFPTSPKNIIKYDLNTENADVTYMYYNLFMKERFMSIVELSVIVISLIGFIISSIIYMKNRNKLSYYEEKLYKLYKSQMIELKIGIILLFLIIAIIAPAFGFGVGYGKNFNIISIIHTTALIICIIFLIKNIKSSKSIKDLFKNNALGKTIKFKNNTSLSFNKRNAIFLFILTILELFLLYICVILGYPPICFILIIVIFAIVIYFDFKSSFNDIDNLKNGTSILSKGNLEHKILVNENSVVYDICNNINNLGDGLKLALENEVKSERMKTELITNVSHDLKTPLTSIINYVDLLKREQLSPEYLNDYVSILDQKSIRLKTLIDDLFEASKATSGSIELNIEKIELKRLLSQSIAEMEIKLIESNLNIKFNNPINKVYVDADGRKLFRVFENLLSNICKYSLENTRVYIDLITDENFAYIYMKNISAYELNFNATELTERFKRGDLSRNTEGSGLGLSIVKGFIELHGGKFEIQIDGDLFKTIIQLPLSFDQ